MAAYIVGMIVGTVSLIFPVIYSMHVDTCVAAIITAHPDLSSARFTPHCPETLLLGTSVLGAVVLLLSAAMMAFTGLRRLRQPQA